MNAFVFFLSSLTLVLSYIYVFASFIDKVIECSPHKFIAIHVVGIQRYNGLDLFVIVVGFNIVTQHCHTNYNDIIYIL